MIVICDTARLNFVIKFVFLAAQLFLKHLSCARHLALLGIVSVFEPDNGSGLKTKKRSLLRHLESLARLFTRLLPRQQWPGVT